jgi:hypothetical protein
MENRSTKWADSLPEIAMAMNAQIHSIIGCAPVNLLFRDLIPYTSWVDSQIRKDPIVGIE